MKYDDQATEVGQHKCFRCEYGSYTGMGFVCMLVVCAKGSKIK